MTDTNWPNPERPGVPMFPDISARHVLENKKRKVLKLAFWDHEQEHYCTEVGYLTPTNVAAMGFDYYAACLTPTQISEMLAGERDRCVDACRSGTKDVPKGDAAALAYNVGRIACASDIRNLGAAS
ncbi:hypothetical protein HK19_11740 [Acetobacter persici]|uniref:hypothetical protein n=1 Tax=Acetobacter persici TaxID=1076596 RepID=UPI000A371F2E|nr:hypothetical protein [Acetobacter persici]OUI90122.1 hypothetical protein HK19_11740 [Acetobacter persici]